MRIASEAATKQMGVFQQSLKMRLGVIIAAAGRGQRLGFSCPKAFLSFDGKFLFEHSLETFLRHSNHYEIALVVPEERLKEVPQGPYHIIPGGETRQDSVERGFYSLSSECEWVFIHDAARPFVTVSILDKLAEQIRLGRNCITAWPISDTVKEVQDGIIIQTQDRRHLWQAQTPQVFERGLLKEAFAKAKKDHFQGTDESSIVERLGIPIYAVLGDPWNIKITAPDDVKLAEMVLRRGR